MPLGIGRLSDVLRITRRLCAELYSRDIDSVLEHFGLKTENRHRAIGDCIATQLIYERLREEILRNYGTPEDFSKTFKAYAPKKPKIITNKTVEEWKTQLYGCKSVKSAFQTVEKLNLTAGELRKFAEYVGVNVHKYAGKNDIITALVYRMIDDKLSA